MNRILVVHGERQARRRLERLFLDNGDFKVTLVDSYDRALDELSQAVPSLMLLCLPLGEIPGRDAVAALHSVAPKMPVVVLSSQGGTDETIEVIKAGAFDCLLEPFHDEDLLEVIDQGMECGRLMASPVAISPRRSRVEGEAIIGRSKPIQKISKAIGRVAPTDATVLIRGASGTGKELVARAIYQHSARVDGPFVVVNCVAIPETLLESELFGFERGAFTGAVQRRIGKVEQADGGTIFLDEIGDVPLPVQAKLLRLLEDRKIERIGGRDPIPVDVRILAATNRDLEAAIAAERFRSDLFYRLNVVPIHLPPLVERTGDVRPLSDYFMNRFAMDLGVRNPGLEEEAYAALGAHDWPGNVRELANLMEQCLIFSRGQRVSGDMVRQLLGGGRDASTDPFEGADEALVKGIRWALANDQPDLLAAVTQRATRLVVQEALRHTGGNRSHAARLLGVSRPTLAAKMQKLGIR
ncbi:MAG: sigma-54 dependent transcriptional regulator [Thermoanaerobaculales bacterium]|nr:sigma-54 dependent transcriptional regulator [Thermoanaerobaculales bacterium]